jgi:hypothetical protein
MATEGSSEKPAAVVYLFQGVHVEDDLDRCIDHCVRNGYRTVAVVIEDGDGDRWAEVERMVTDERAAVVVVARPEHLPPGRVPRGDVVAERRHRGEPDRVGGQEISDRVPRPAGGTGTPPRRSPTT